LTAPAPLRRAVNTIVQLLRQGVTPEKIALAIALSAAIGVFPVLGTTMLLTAGAAAALELNLVAMQLVGWLVYPVQLALLVPFMRLGSRLFGLVAVPPLPELLKLMAHDLLGTIRLFWPATLTAIVAWLILCPIVVGALYGILIYPLRRLDRRLGRSSQSEPQAL
jgi:uncharacterized protein (DUF2062 family)